MSIKETEWHSFQAWGSATHTIDVNIVPDNIFAQVSLFAVYGGDRSLAGIVEYRERLDSGKDKVHDFGTWLTWVPAVYDFMSSITFGISTYDLDNQAGLIARMDHWS